VTAGGTYGASGSNQCATGDCVYSFNVTTPLTGYTKPVDGLAAAGGSSGIIIDNVGTTAGASQIYFGTLAAQTCNGNGTTGSGNGGCAVQASQAALQ
jgi:hypothetical protein